MKKRLDHLLVDKDLAPSRSQARLLIKEGYVSVDGKKITKVGQFFSDQELIQIDKEVQYVGRGAQKLEAAIQSFDIAPKGLIIADIGASTGGFTDLLLRQGASRAYAIDVGHDQLALALREDSRVVNMEGINIRYGVDLPEKIDLAVIDLSYISLRLILEEVYKLLAPSGEIITLIKPQFEAGRKNIGKKGIIKDVDVRLSVLEELYDWCLDRGHKVSGAIRSPIEGKTGNVEFFFHLEGKKEISRNELAEI